MKLCLYRNLFFFFILNILLFFSFLGSHSFAQQNNNNTNNTNPGLQNLGQNARIPNITRYNSLEDIINALTGLIRPLFIITFFGILLYGAWLWLTSQGDPEKIKKARLVITSGIIGFALAVFAPNIVQIVGNLLGVNNPFSLITNNTR